jgi:hypothetical protein
MSVSIVIQGYGRTEVRDSGFGEAGGRKSNSHHVIARYEAIANGQRDYANPARFTTTSLRGTKQSHGSREAMKNRPVQFAIASYLAMTGGEEF